MDFDKNWPIKTSFGNQDLIQPLCLWIYHWKVTRDKNFDRVNGITLTKFSLSKFSIKKLWSSLWRKLWSFKQAFSGVNLLEQSRQPINERNKTNNFSGRSLRIGYVLEHLNFSLKKSNKTGHAYSQIVYSNSRQVSSNNNRTKQITSSSQLSFCPLSGVIYMINGNHLREQKWTKITSTANFEYFI